MTSDLEYAIKQDIRNNPVVREVDRAQKRELVRTLGWGVLSVCMLMFALMPRTSLVATGYKLEDLREELAQEVILQRQYKLDLEVALRPQALQKRATQLLSMIEPREEDTIVLERVPATAPPSRSIVAAAR